MKSHQYVAGLDSSSTMLRSVAAYLHGKDFPGLGLLPPAAGPVMSLVNALPANLKQRLFIWSGWNEAVRPEKLGGFRAEEFAAWAVRQYPQRRYPAVMIGSSNGAAVHLAAALGIPWLPQTFLIPVRRPWLHPDRVGGDIEWGQRWAPSLLAANPDLELHQMRDPNQDRLMTQRMTYFRLKRTALGASYEQFLRESLVEGGVIIILECRKRWQVARIGERHIFQLGGVGALEPDEYLAGSNRTAAFLRREQSPVRHWETPRIDCTAPEAEWGFAPALGNDVERFAQRQGYRVARLVFDEPEDFSPLVADLYRWWYRQRGLAADRLLVESFVLLEPWWTLRLGLVSYWSAFSVQPSVARLEAYLKTAAPYAEISLTDFSHGIESAGFAAPRHWRAASAGAATCLIGVDERRYPRDFASLLRFHAGLKSQTAAHFPMPRPLTLGKFESFMREVGDRYGVQWTADPAGTQPAAAYLADKTLSRQDTTQSRRSEKP
jgi:hypothetical protein